MFALFLDDDREKVVRFIRDSIAHIGPEVNNQSIQICVVGETLGITVGSKSGKFIKIGMNSQFSL